MMVELIVGIIIQNVELLSKMEDMKIKETHIQVPEGTLYLCGWGFSG